MALALEDHLSSAQLLGFGDAREAIARPDGAPESDVLQTTKAEVTAGNQRANAGGSGCLPEVRKRAAQMRNRQSLRKRGWSGAEVVFSRT
jgi:hypothetical protein